MNKSIIIIFSVLFLLIYTSCGEEFLNKTDETSVNSASFYQNEEQAVAAVTGVYAHLQNLSLWGRRIHFLLDFSSDEIAPTSNTQGPPLELLLHTFGPQGNEHIENPWQMFYQTIAKANATILNINDMDPANISQETRAQVIGQARFLRALSYFYINALWNGGPLKTEENLGEFGVPRAPASEIWTLIEQDLTDAATTLPWSWDANNVGRATKGAALSLLGKSHLYQEEWAEAESALMQVIDEGPYYLMGGPEDPTGAATSVEEAIVAMRSNHAFGVKNNGEAVFEVQFLAGAGGLSWDSNNAGGLAETTIRPHEYGVDGFSFYNAKPSTELLSEFTSNGGTGIGDRDPRFEAFFFTENDTLLQGGTTPVPYIEKIPNVGYAWKKYQHETLVSTINDNDVNHDVIRYADVILMAAEAKIRQGKVAEGMAMVNTIRRRADPAATILPDRPLNISEQEAMDFLISERRIELAGEQVRRTDLVRWGIADQYITGFQVGKHEYFPIPQNEINANSAMSEADQNPGYN